MWGDSTYICIAMGGNHNTQTRKDLVELEWNFHTQFPVTATLKLNLAKRVSSAT